VSYLRAHLGDVAQFLLQHVELTAAALAIASVIAVPLGVLAARRPRIGQPVVALLGIIYTIPSLALLGVLVLWLGLGFWTAVVALAAYAQMMLVRNIAAGISGVDRGVVEAARGMGLSEWQILWKVERPLAMPLAIAGFRIATVSVIAIATVAAWIGAGGLGTLIFAGIDQQNYAKAVIGALAAVLLAAIADLALRALEQRSRRLTGT